MYDINEKINDIIFKYNLDKNYPEYRKMYKAQIIFREIVCYLKSENRSAIFVCGNAVQVKILQHLLMGYSNAKIVLFDGEIVSSDNVIWNEFDKIYVVPFFEKKEVMSFLAKKENAAEWIYDIFEDRGLFFQKEFYMYSHHCDEIQELYEKGEIFTRKAWARVLQLEAYYERENSENCFFLALLMRNFNYAEQKLKQLIATNIEKENYQGAWDEIQILLKDICEKLKERQERDVIIYWLDALGYGDEYGMEYLCNRIEQSISFTQAHTVTAFTLPTVRTMFCGIKTVDDRGYRMRKITDESSELLQKINELGYDFKVISGYMEWQDEKYTSMEYHEMWDACSAIYWDMLQNLLLAEKPIVLLAHVLDIHEGMSVKMADVSFVGNWKEHFEWAKQEVNESLAFYDDFISDKAVRLYLSDHGNSRARFDKQHHVLLNIWEKGQTPKTIKNFFSYMDFTKLLSSILEQKRISEKEYAREYVEIQDVYIYSSKLINDFIRNKSGFVGFWLLGYKGVISNKYLYVCSGTGEEWLTDRGDFIEPELFGINPTNDEDLLNLFRERTGEYPNEILADSQFCYSRFIYEIYKKQKRYLEHGLANVRNVLDEALEVFPDNSIAIRMGGAHSKWLYNIMSAKGKRKVRCFIDQNPMCECSTLGIPVITLADSFSEEIEGIILSSFVHQDMLRREAEAYENLVEVIDLYQLLERDGITNNEKEFYYELMPEEIWTVESVDN